MSTHDLSKIFGNSGRVILAPMAGVADRAMRELCRGYGAAFCVGELCSAKGVELGDKKSRVLLSVYPDERPMGVQLFGDSPDTMAAAAQIAMSYEPDFIDINMGCPAPKVAQNGGGSALMKSPGLAQRIVRAVAGAVDVPVSVKMRAGWDADSINAVELAKMCEQAGAAFITVHGRTRAQMYAPPVDWNIIAQVKQAVSVPVIGNGDITDGRSAAACLEQTGCDMIMVGRAACGAPWIFAHINAYLNHGRTLPEPPLSERMAVMVRHVRAIVGYKGEHIGMLEARKFAAWYIKGLKNAAKYRTMCCSLSSIGQLEELAGRVCLENAGG